MPTGQFKQKHLNMKSIMQLLTFAFVLTLGTTMYAQVSDYCGIMKASVLNVKQVNNGIEFDIYLRSAKSSTEPCGELRLGHTDIWVDLQGGDFSKATIEKLGESTLSSKNDNGNPYSFVKTYYTNASSVGIYDNLAVINVNGPSASDQGALDNIMALLDNAPKAHKLGRYRIANYNAINPNVAIYQMDRGVVSVNAVAAKKEGRKGFLSKSHTMAMDQEGKVVSFAVKVVPDYFLSQELESFDAKKVTKSDAKVNWEVKTIAKLDKYILQRSDDNKTWSEIGSWEADNSIMDFVDKNVYSGNEIQKVVYYRLKLVGSNDYDFTDTKAVVFSNINITNATANGEGWSLYPNPSTEGVFVDMKGLSTDTKIDKIMVMDITGKTVINRDVLEFTTREYIKFGNTNALASGMYFVQLMSGDVVIDQKKLEVQ